MTGKPGYGLIDGICEETYWQVFFMDFYPLPDPWTLNALQCATTHNSNPFSKKKVGLDHFLPKALKKKRIVKPLSANALKAGMMAAFEAAGCEIIDKRHA